MRSIQRKTEIAQRICPDCSKPVTFLYELNTDWYGILKYFKCKRCFETFVLRESDSLAIAARI